MQRAILFLEAYVPGLESKTAQWTRETQRGITALLRRDNQDAYIIVIPEDEMLLVLAWRDEEPAETTAVRNSATLMAAVLGSAPSAVVQRIVDAQLILPADRRDE